jgi:hypothetical protein
LNLWIQTSDICIWLQRGLLHLHNGYHGVHLILQQSYHWQHPEYNKKSLI